MLLRAVRVIATVVGDRSGGTMGEDTEKAGGRRYRPDLPAARCLVGQLDTIGQRVERIVAVADAVSRHDHDSEFRRVGRQWFADRFHTAARLPEHPARHSIRSATPLEIHLSQNSAHARIDNNSTISR